MSAAKKQDITNVLCPEDQQLAAEAWRYLSKVLTRCNAYNDGYRYVPRDLDGNLRKDLAFKIPSHMRIIGHWMPTCITSKDAGSELCHLLTFDIDYLGSQDCWKKSGQLNYRAVKKMLFKKMPSASKKLLLSICRSTGGQGLCIIFKLAPFDIDKASNKQTIVAFEKTQLTILKFFQKHGLNADAGALGVKRLCVNYYNPKLCLYYNKKIHDSVEAEYKAQCALYKAATDEEKAARSWKGRKQSNLSLLREEVEATSSNPTRVAKKHDSSRLHAKDSVQREIAYFLKLMGLNKLGVQTKNISNKEMCELTNLSPYIVSKILNNKAHTSHYMTAERLKNGGYRLTFELSKQLVSLVDLICRQNAENKAPKACMGHVSWPLLKLQPEQVMHGDRFSYLSTIVLALKLRGYSKQRNQDIVEQVANRLNCSRSARYAKNQVKSFYKRHLELVGAKSRLKLPVWLQNVIDAPGEGEKPRSLAAKVGSPNLKLVANFEKKKCTDDGVNNNSNKGNYTKEQFSAPSRRGEADKHFNPQFSKILSLKPFRDKHDLDSTGFSIHEAEAKPRRALNFGDSEKENLNGSLKKAAAQAAKPLDRKAVKVSVDGYFLYRGNYYSTPKYAPKFCDVHDSGNGEIELIAKGKTVCTHSNRAGKGQWITDSTHEQSANYKGLQWVADSASKERGCNSKTLYADLIKGDMENRSRKLRRLWKSKFLTMLDEFESYKGSNNIPDDLRVVGTLRDFGMTKASLKPARGYVSGWIKRFKRSSYGNGADGLTCLIADIVQENPEMLKKPLKYWDERIQ